MPIPLAILASLVIALLVGWLFIKLEEPEDLGSVSEGWRRRNR
jgi:hypothetical protein